MKDFCFIRWSILLVLGVSSQAFAASGSADIDGGSGTYNVSQASPDTFTATDSQGRTLIAKANLCGGSSEKPNESIEVQEVSGSSATFTGRSVHWGGHFTVGGVFGGGGWGWQREWQRQRRRNLGCEFRCRKCSPYHP